jgi:redox-sensitive bicupin YhaK (pirin superfamily)
MSNKTIRRLHPAVRDDIGDLLTQRPLPNPHLDQLDPFLFLNHHGPQVYPPDNHGLPFGPHPHRGFETVTFILDGMLTHKDSAGHESIIRAGGVQWMTAGRGIVHAEVSPREFLRSGGPLEILQLWVNLPGRLKMTAPDYTGLQREDIPALVAAPGVTLNLVAGEWNGVAGPVSSLTGVFMSTIEMRAGSSVHLPDLQSRTVFRDRHNLTVRPRRSDRRTGGVARPVRDEHARADRRGDQRLPGRPLRRPALGGRRAYLRVTATLVANGRRSNTSFRSPLADAKVRSPAGMISVLLLPISANSLCRENDTRRVWPFDKS